MFGILCIADNQEGNFTHCSSGINNVFLTIIIQEKTKGMKVGHRHTQIRIKDVILWSQSLMKRAVKNATRKQYGSFNYSWLLS